jgi:D-tyrosyl-tRNA(Tyr) deacylase
LVLAAAHRDDTPKEAAKMADRLAGLRIFNDDSGRMNLALRDQSPTAAPQILAVSNFTVYGETGKNRRPSFSEAAPFDRGKDLFEELVTALRATGLSVNTGIFGADMKVEVLNDGPVTVIVEVPPPASIG